MKIEIGILPILPEQEEGVFYPGNWSLIPLSCEVPIHEGFLRIFDEYGFYHLSDRSSSGLAGLDSTTDALVFMDFQELIGANLQFWVEDVEKNPVIRAQLARVYGNSYTPVMRIHPKQFQRLLQLNKLKPDNVWISVTCLTHQLNYTFKYQGELKLPPLDTLKAQTSVLTYL